MSENIFNIAIGDRIDENFTAPHIPENDTETIVIDFENTHSVNSTGIGHWIKFIDEVNSNNNVSKIVFQNTTSPIINQMNTVKDFLPSKGTIESFFLPLYCNECDTQFNHRVIVNDDSLKQLKDIDQFIATIKCSNSDNCSGKIEADTIPNKYLRFLNK